MSTLISHRNRFVFYRRKIKIWHILVNRLSSELRNIQEPENHPPIRRCTPPARDRIAPCQQLPFRPTCGAPFLINS